MFYLISLMPQLSFILQQSRKYSLDSSFQSLDRMSRDSWFSFENPMLFSMIAVVIILAVTFIYYRYVIVPMRKKHLLEQENLRLQQAELMALFSELSPDPIFRFDLYGKIILANNSAHRIFPTRVLVGEQVEMLLPFIKSFDIKDIITNAKTVNYTTLLDDTYFQFLISGVSKFNVCQVYGRDITDLKIKEKELKSALVRAEEAKKLKEQFLAQISHEIRSPLNVIVGYSDLLKNDYNDGREDYSGILRSIKNNSKRLYRTFDLLLNMSQLQTSKYETRFEKVDLYSVLKTVYNEFQSYAEEKNLELNLTNNIKGEAIVTVDHYSIAQLFMNLVDNAIKYTESGNIDLIMHTESSNICIDIKDSGIGISKDYLQKLFTPFSQEDMSYTRPFEGTGLGLALVKGFADLNRAKLRVNSTPNNGTTFTVIFSGENKWGLKN